MCRIGKARINSPMCRPSMSCVCGVQEDAKVWCLKPAHLFVGVVGSGGASAFQARLVRVQRVPGGRCFCVNLGQNKLLLGVGNGPLY